MVRYGTVVNGVVVFDGPPPPDGTRMAVEPAEDAVPPADETREEFLASLRQSIADAKAGLPGFTVDEAFAAVDVELAKFADPAEKSR